MILGNICILLLAIHGAYTSELKEAECRMVYDKYDYQAAASRNFMFGETWPENKIPYTIDDGFSESDLKVIRDAMRHIEAKVCVQWVERSGQSSYVRIKHNERGCFASLGYNRQREVHNLNLQRGNGYSTCMIMGIAAHEMLHIMGFAHEQTRADRDKYVKVLWPKIDRWAISNYFRNIEAGSSERPPVCDSKSQQVSFDKCYSGFRTNTFGMGYDFGSIMHYGLNDFTVSGEDTMEVLAPVPAGVVIGNRKGMTELDAKKAQAKYGCNGQTTTTRKPGVECRDRYTQCPNYTDHCSSNQQVREGCRVSCGFCNECYDHYTNCGDFAGQCGGNDDVDAKCRLTCGTCEII